MDDVLRSILRLCVAIEERALPAFRAMARVEEEPELAAFWSKMAQEEERHLGYWRRLLEMVQRDELPQVFDEPYQVANELRAVLRDVRALTEGTGGRPTREGLFLMAFGLEFYLLHPAFGTLLTLLRSDYERCPNEEYEEHINEFMKAMDRHAVSTPQLRLVGSAIRRIWHQNRQLQRQSHIDPVTGLYNRRGFDEVVLPLAYLARRTGNPVGFLLADIDNLKAINDTLGHQAGDDVLKAVAGTLRSVIRRSDVAGRAGGDEFVVFLSSLDPSGMRKFSEEVRSSIEAADGAAAAVTVSVGVASGRLPGNVEQDLAALAREADTCLYQAKSRGRNQVVISST